MYINRMQIFKLLLVHVLFSSAAASDPGTFLLQTRQRVNPTGQGGNEEVSFRTVEWDPHKTAIIICDMWDKHWCAGATARVAEMAPRMNRFISNARDMGVLIVHCPSSCMEVYKEHPARILARNAPQTNLPVFLKKWNRGGLPSEEGVVWPIDQTDGGCDCQPKCPVGQPWKRQIETIEISEKDAISDSGLEIAGLFVKRCIDNVMLVGVHTNMCVIGRSFGLRNMVQLGKNVVLVRDLTDTMYNSRMWPYVPHVRGTELIVEYIEKYVCPTITSSSLPGGSDFQFK